MQWHVKNNDYSVVIDARSPRDFSGSVNACLDEAGFALGLNGRRAGGYIHGMSFQHAAALSRTLQTAVRDYIRELELTPELSRHFRETFAPAKEPSALPVAAPQEQPRWIDRARTVHWRLSEFDLRWNIEAATYRTTLSHGHVPMYAQLDRDGLRAQVFDFGLASEWSIKSADADLGGTEASFDLAIVRASEELLRTLDVLARSTANKLK